MEDQMKARLDWEEIGKPNFYALNPREKSVQKEGSDEHCLGRLSEMRLDNWPLDFGTGGVISAIVNINCGGMKAWWEERN